jgi:hypothetical protein
MTPRRIQRQRTKGWRMPANTAYVGRPSKWGNPFALDSDWLLWAGVALGFKGHMEDRRQAAIAFYRWWMTGVPPTARPIQPGGEMSFRSTATGETFELPVDRAVRGLGGKFAGLYPAPSLPQKPSVEELRGMNLACFCRLDQPCHVDVLLEMVAER